jgi:hypothetical protein
MKETLKLLTAIQATYPTHRDHDDESQMRLKAQMWHIHFAEFDYQEVFEALYKYVSVEKFPPSIAEIKELVAKNRNPEAFKTGESAWNEVLSSVKQFGYYQQEKAFEGFDMQTKRLVQSLGWGAICQCAEDKIGILRSNFCKMWDNVKTEERESQLFPVEAIKRLREYESKRLGKSE